MRISLRHINNGITIVIIVICSSVIVAPLLPALLFHLDERRGLHMTSPYPIHSFQSSKPPASSRKPSENRVVIPSAGINEILIQGTESSLKRGIWVQNGTSTPDKGSNTVLAGHRFLYTNRLFYNLDKVHEHDIIAVYWNSKEYNYTVTSVSVVSPDTSTILTASDEPILTLYTCTPLWTAKNRLVVRATLTYTDL